MYTLYDMYKHTCTVVHHMLKNGVKNSRRVIYWFHAVDFNFFSKVRCTFVQIKQLPRLHNKQKKKIQTNYLLNVRYTLKHSFEQILIKVYLNAWIFIA